MKKRVLLGMASLLLSVSLLMAQEIPAGVITAFKRGSSQERKQGTATILVSFEIGSREELQRITDKIRTIESVIDIERTTG